MYQILRADILSVDRIGRTEILTALSRDARKEMTLENAIVTVDIERSDEVEKFTRDIQLVGNLSAAEKERLLEIANKCPIHKALSGEIQIKTQLAN